MLVCIKDGVQLTCMKNGAYLFNERLTKYRHGDAYQCSQCGQSLIEGWGENYLERPHEKIQDIIFVRELDENGNWDGFLRHSEIVHDKEPFCLECQRLMVDEGEGVLFLSSGHAYKKGKVWQCLECGNKIIKVGYEGWPPPLSEEEKKAVIDKYSDKVFYLSR